jgi:hypothetical protein
MKLSAVAKAEIRRRRGEGEKLAALAVEYGVVESTVYYHCRVVRPPPRPRPGEPRRPRGRPPRLTEEARAEMRRRRACGETYKSLAISFGVSATLANYSCQD